MALYSWQREGKGSPEQELNPSPTPRIQTTSTPSGNVVEPASLENILKVTGSDEADYLTALITSATNWVENWLGRFLLSRTAVLWLDFQPSGNAIEINCSPVTAITTLSVFSDDDTETELSSSTDYRTDLMSEPARVVFRTGFSRPSGLRNVNAIKLAFTAGYADAAAVPENIKTAIRLIVAEVYLARGVQLDAKEFDFEKLVPASALLLMEPFKVVR